MCFDSIIKNIIDLLTKIYNIYNYIINCYDSSVKLHSFPFGNNFFWRGCLNLINIKVKE